MPLQDKNKFLRYEVRRVAWNAAGWGPEKLSKREEAAQECISNLKKEMRRFQGAKEATGFIMENEKKKLVFILKEPMSIC